VPDPAGLAAVDLTNPQTWNRYAYVGNNPLNAVDPLGLECGQETPTAPDNGGITITVTAPCPSWWTFVIQGLPQYAYCSMTGSCSPYPPGGGGGGGTGGSTSQPQPTSNPSPTPANNAPKSSVEQQCLSQFYSSGPGKAIAFLSPLQVIPGWGQDPLKSTVEYTVGLAAKYGILKTAANGAAQPAVQTIFTDATSYAFPRLMPAVLSLTKVAAPYIYGYAAGLDVLAHAGCASVASQEAGMSTVSPVAQGQMP